MEEVLVQDIRGVRKWLDGTVTDQPGPVSYKVLVGEQLWKVMLTKYTKSI